MAPRVFVEGSIFMKRVLVNSVLLTAMMSTTLVACDKGAKGRQALKDDQAKAAPAATPTPATPTPTAGTLIPVDTKKLEPDTKKNDADKAKAEAARIEAARLAQAELDEKKRLAQRAASKEEKERAALAEKERLAKEKADREKAEQERLAAKKPAADAAAADAKPAEPVAAKPAAEAPAAAASPAKVIDISEAPAPIKAASKSLVRIIVPDTSTGTVTAEELAKGEVLKMTDKDLTMNKIIGAVKKAKPNNMVLLLIQLQNCGDKAVPAKCDIFQKAQSLTGFVSASDEKAKSTTLTTSASVINSYYKTYITTLKATPEVKAPATAAELKEALSKPAALKAIVTYYELQDPKKNNYIANDGVSKNLPGLSLESISEEALQAIVGGSYSDSKLSPQKNVVTIKLNQKLDLPALATSQSGCKDLTSKAQEANIIGRMAKKVEGDQVAGEDAAPPKPGKKVASPSVMTLNVSTNNTTPALKEAIAKLKTGNIDFAKIQDTTELEQNLLILESGVTTGYQGSPILNDKGEVFGMLTTTGTSASTMVYGACIEKTATK